MWHVFLTEAVAMEGSFQGGERTWAETGIGEDLTKVRWPAEINSEVFFLGDCGWWGLRKGYENLL